MTDRTRPKLRHCPKCGGNMYMDSDEHGWFEHCLQCGFTAEQGRLVQKSGAASHK